MGRAEIGLGGGIREEAVTDENKEGFSRSAAKPQAITG